MTIRNVAGFVAFHLLVAGAAGGAAAPDAELHPGLRIELFAQEPDIIDPVALTIDEKGLVYVVEMRDYPYGFGPERKPGGVIRVLNDRDGDGQADSSVVFAEGLSFPTSIAPWNGGVLVTAPPEIVFLKDADGDGRAEVREVMFEGFTLGVTDSNVNGLRWALDNRVHGSNGGNGGQVRSRRKPGSPVSVRDLDFRFDPRTGVFEATYRSSNGFGLVFDDWGRSFCTYNIDHIQHRIIPVRYLERYPGLPPSRATTSISDHGAMAAIFPVSAPETRVNHPEQSGHFSAAGGMGYLGIPNYPGDLSGSVFVCDVVGNLVHRDRLIEQGPSFVAVRSPAEQRREFFASRDNAFRPVGLEAGPDGALYLIDMQRGVIEHPDYIPAKVLRTLDVRAGERRGRIYRIAPAHAQDRPRRSLGRARAAELAGFLSHPEQWWRVTAQRLLLERADHTTASMLEGIASDGRVPLARLHALWTLEGLGALEESTVLRALADSEPGIREHGLILAERFDSPLIVDKARSLADDPAVRVRFQAALTLGSLPGIDPAPALTRILRRDSAYRWSRLAALSSLRRGAHLVLEQLARDEEFRARMGAAGVEVIRELADLTGARAGDEPGTAAVLDVARNLPEPYQIAIAEGLEGGLARIRVQVPDRSAVDARLEELARRAAPRLIRLLWKISRALELPDCPFEPSLAAASVAAGKPAEPIERRIESIRVLELGKFSDVRPVLSALLGGRESAAIQSAVIEVLGQFDDPQVATVCLDQWRRLAPAARPRVIDLLLRRPALHPALITAIETGQIHLGELNLDLEQRRRLMRQSTPEVMTRAARLMGDEEYSNRKALVEDWLARLPTQGNPQRGRAHFETRCAQCHRIGDLGVAVGPDLGSVAHRSVEDLLSNILDPNMAIAPQYAGYTLQLESGDIESGILESDSAGAVTLVQPLGRRLTVPRPGIRTMTATGISLMPEGLEAGLTPQDLRDLIAFLQE